MTLPDPGNLILTGFHGTSFSSEVREFLDDLRPCGVILFARNIDAPVQLAKLTHDLQSHWWERYGHGLFIGVDQEGGRVNRLRDPFKVFPPAMEMALSHDPEVAVRDFARVTARQLRTVGINLDFVPVLDVPISDGDPTACVIGDRAYGHDADTVWRLGSMVLETMRSGGVIPCCKHFPGHGGTLVDSHRALPVDERSLAQLWNCDLVPFSRAVAASAEMIMTAHVVFSRIDPENPATLSREIIEGLLRRTMGYSGLVVTDDLDMAAVANGRSARECAVHALHAGVDVLMFCNDPEKPLLARDRLAEALKTGEISAARIGRSLERVRGLKNGYDRSLRPCSIRAVKESFPQHCGTAGTAGS